MGIVGNQPPVIIPPAISKQQMLALINQNFQLLGNQLQSFSYSDNTFLTRPASSNSASKDIVSGVFNAPGFVAFAYAPNASPLFLQPLPFHTFDTTNGAWWRGLRVLYDPTTSVIRCFIDASAVFPTYSTAETWQFFFFLLKPLATG